MTNRTLQNAFIIEDLPDPATPTVAAPAPMNLAAESMSLVTEVVWKERTAESWAGAAGTICACDGMAAATGRTSAELLKIYNMKRKFQLDKLSTEEVTPWKSIPYQANYIWSWNLQITRDLLQLSIQLENAIIVT